MRIFCGLMSRWAILLLCKYRNACSISRMQIWAWGSVSSPSSSRIACNSPPVALQNRAESGREGKEIIQQIFKSRKKKEKKKKKKTYNSSNRAVSEAVSWTLCNLTMCFESLQSNSTATSCPMSLSELCARRLRRKNFAAKFTPVFLCTALRTAANFPLQWTKMKKRKDKISIRIKLNTNSGKEEILSLTPPILFIFCDSCLHWSSIYI